MIVCVSARVQDVSGARTTASGAWLAITRSSTACRTTSSKSRKAKEGPCPSRQSQAEGRAQRAVAPSLRPLDEGSAAPGASATRSYKSSSSSGSGAVAAFSSSASYCCTVLWSMRTSGGLSAGDSTNERLGSPTSFRASQRKGFSKL